MDFTNIIISNHALKRFKEKWIKYIKKPIPNKPELKIKEIMSRSIEIRRSPISNVNAIINHGKKARYFKERNLIFVTDEDLKIIITVYWYDRINKYMWIMPKK